MSIEHFKKGGHRVIGSQLLSNRGSSPTRQLKKRDLSRGTSCVVDMGVPPGWPHGISKEFDLWLTPADPA